MQDYTMVKFAVLKIPKGKFWIGKSDPVGISIQDFNAGLLAVIWVDSIFELEISIELNDKYNE